GQARVRIGASRSVERTCRLADRQKGARLRQATLGATQRRRIPSFDVERIVLVEHGTLAGIERPLDLVHGVVGIAHRLSVGLDQKLEHDLLLKQGRVEARAQRDVRAARQRALYYGLVAS